MNQAIRGLQQAENFVWILRPGIMVFSAHTGIQEIQESGNTGIWKSGIQTKAKMRAIKDPVE